MEFTLINMHSCSIILASYPGLLTPALVLQATNTGVREGLGTRLESSSTRVYLCG